MEWFITYLAIIRMQVGLLWVLMGNASVNLLTFHQDIFSSLFLMGQKLYRVIHGIWLIGDAKNGINVNFGNVKSGSRPTASAKTNNFPSMKANGTVANKYSLPFDSKPRQSAAPSNFSKSLFHSQPLKPLNKASHLGSDFPTGFAKGFNPINKFSSFTSTSTEAIKSAAPALDKEWCFSSASADIWPK